MTAFRLVRFAPGSGVATIEPESLSSTDDRELPLDDVPLAVENLRALLDEIDSGAALPDPVRGALGKACRSLGNDGSIAPPA